MAKIQFCLPPGYTAGNLHDVLNPGQPFQTSPDTIPLTRDTPLPTDCDNYAAGWDGGYDQWNPLWSMYLSTTEGNLLITNIRVYPNAPEFPAVIEGNAATVPNPFIIESSLEHNGFICCQVEGAARLCVTADVDDSEIPPRWRNLSGCDELVKIPSRDIISPYGSNSGGIGTTTTSTTTISPTGAFFRLSNAYLMPEYASMYFENTYPTVNQYGGIAPDNRVYVQEFYSPEHDIPTSDHRVRMQIWNPLAPAEEWEWLMYLYHTWAWHVIGKGVPPIGENASAEHPPTAWTFGVASNGAGNEANETIALGLFFIPGVSFEDELTQTGYMLTTAGTPGDIDLPGPAPCQVIDFTGIPYSLYASVLSTYPWVEPVTGTVIVSYASHAVFPDPADPSGLIFYDASEQRWMFKYANVSEPSVPQARSIYVGPYNGDPTGPYEANPDAGVDGLIIVLSSQTDCLTPPDRTTTTTTTTTTSTTTPESTTTAPP